MSKRNKIRFICFILIIIALTSLIIMMIYQENRGGVLLIPFITIFITIGVYLSQEKLEKYE